MKHCPGITVDDDEIEWYVFCTSEMVHTLHSQPRTHSTMICYNVAQSKETNKKEQPRGVCKKGGNLYSYINLDIFARIAFDFRCFAFHCILHNFWFFMCEEQQSTTAAGAATPSVEHNLDKENIRWTFSDMFHSFMVVFRALCGEWVESMYDCILVSGDKSSIVYFHALGFIGSFLVSYYFVIVLFLFRF